MAFISQSKKTLIRVLPVLAVFLPLLPICLKASKIFDCPLLIMFVICFACFYAVFQFFCAYPEEACRILTWSTLDKWNLFAQAVFIGSLHFIITFVPKNVIPLALGTPRFYLYACIVILLFCIWSLYIIATVVRMTPEAEATKWAVKLALSKDGPYVLSKISGNMPPEFSNGVKYAVLVFGVVGGTIGGYDTVANGILNRRIVAAAARAAEIQNQAAEIQNDWDAFKLDEARSKSVRESARESALHEIELKSQSLKLEQEEPSLIQKQRSIIQKLTSISSLWKK